MDYRRRWQENRLRRTRRRLLIGIGACVLILLLTLPFYLHERRGLAWVFTPEQGRLVHFAASGPNLFAVWDSGHVALLDLATGRPRVNSDFSTPFPLLAEPLLLQDRALFGGDDGRLRALSLTTGEVLWECATGGAIRACPVPFGDRVLVGSDDGFLYAIEAATGRMAWRLPCGGKIGATLALCGGTSAVVSTVDNGIFGLALSPSGPEEASPAQGRWRLATGAPALAPVVAAGSGRVAVVGTDEGRVYLLDPASGQKLGQLDFPGLVRDTPAVTTRYVLAADDSGLVQAATLEGQLLWSRQLPGPLAAGLTAGPAAAYLATTRGEIYALRLSDGRRLWRYRLPAPAAGSLQLTPQLVLVGLADGRICAVRRPAER